MEYNGILTVELWYKCDAIVDSDSLTPSLSSIQDR